MLFLHYALSQNNILYPYSNKWKLTMQKQSEVMRMKFMIDMKWIQ